MAKPATHSSYQVVNVTAYVPLLFNKPKFSDFTITNRDGTKKLPVHKCILAAGNDYFRTLFASELKKDNILVVDNFPMAEKLISSLYGSNITVDLTKINTDDFLEQGQHFAFRGDHIINPAGQVQQHIGNSS